MKRALLIAIGSLILSGQVFASFKEVKSTLCNGVLQESKIDRVFIDLDRSIIGFAQTEVSGEQTCKVADFTSVIITSHSNLNGEIKATIQPAFEIGRKSSCSETLLDYKGHSFQVAQVSSESLILSNTENCETLEFKLK